jgi:phospholipid/cholesterol/gamma-HCH transport system substrate-binding protein
VKKESINYFAVGLFVLAGLATSMLLLYRLTVAEGGQDSYYCYYRNVSGLGRGTLVSYEGFVFGRVAGIRPQRDEQGIVYEVELAVQKGWKIPDDSVARVHSEGLLADTVIDITEGDSNQFLQAGATLSSAPGIDLFSAMSELAADFGDLSDNSIRPLLAALSQVVQQVGGEIGVRVPVILEATHSLVSKLDQSATHFSEIMNAETVHQTQRILNNADLAVSDLRSLAAGLTQVKHESLELVQKLDQLVTGTRPEVQQAMAALRDILQQVSDYSGDILLNLDNSSRNMSEFSRQIRDNPARLLGGPIPTDAGVRRD